MKLSVIIVNYNVKDFLRQCLDSVMKSIGNIETEVFVVDNNSSDASCQMLREHFPQVTLIENKENTGFSTANNQAIRLAKGDYILLLNPDTVIAEDTLENVCRFMDRHLDTGGLGVKMLNKRGVFLPESKRSLPTAWVSFCKITGLSSLFPKSKTFAQYSLQYLDENQMHDVEVLAGAFMLLRREALDKVGLLDETFFMYGEDIDLSYRLTLGGYKNHYLPEKIIHYKGESTAKDSLRYVKVFYESMQIFYRKHHRNNFPLSLLIESSIRLRASLAALTRLLKRLLPAGEKAVFYQNILVVGDIAPLQDRFPKSVLKETTIGELMEGKQQSSAVVFDTERMTFKEIISVMDRLGGKYEFFIYHPKEKLLI